jgi:hypothetical protein
MRGSLPIEILHKLLLHVPRIFIQQHAQALEESPRDSNAPIEPLYASTRMLVSEKTLVLGSSVNKGIRKGWELIASAKSSVMPGS